MDVQSSESSNFTIYNIYTPTQTLMIDCGFGVTSGLSILGALYMLILIIVRLIRSNNKEIVIDEKKSASTTATFGKDLQLHGNDSMQKSNAKSVKNLWLLSSFGEILVLNLAIADLGSSLFFIGVLVNKYTIGDCHSNVLIFLGTVFEPSSILWVCCISTSLAVILMKTRNFLTKIQITRSLLKQTLIYIFISWGIPVALSLGLFFTRKSSSDWNMVEDTWCLDNKEKEAIYFYYLPVLCAFFYNVIMLSIIYFINKKKKLGLRNFNMMFWVFVFLFVWTMPLVNVVYPKIAKVPYSPFMLQFFASLTLPSQGFLNAIIWSCILYNQPRNPEQIQVKALEEEVFLLGKHTLSKTKINLFGNHIVLFVEH